MVQPRSRSRRSSSTVRKASEVSTKPVGTKSVAGTSRAASTSAASSIERCASSKLIVKVPASKGSSSEAARRPAARSVSTNRRSSSAVTPCRSGRSGVLK